MRTWILPLLVTLSALAVMTFIAVSWSQAYDFLYTMGSTTKGKRLIGAYCLAVLITALLISAWLKHGAVDSHHTAWIGLAVIVGILIEVFSMGTSVAALNNRILNAERTQNTESPEWATHDNRVKLLTNQIIHMQNKIAELPANYHKVETNLYEQMAILDDKLEAAQLARSGVNVSSVGQTFDRIQGMIGLKPEHLTTLAAFLLTVCPHILIGLALPQLGNAMRSRN